MAAWVASPELTKTTECRIPKPGQATPLVFMGVNGSQQKGATDASPVALNDATGKMPMPLSGDTRRPEVCDSADGESLPPMPDIFSTSFTALDFESAGTAPGATDEPVQVAWATMAGGEIEPGSFFTSYLGTQRPITWAARKVHRITDEQLMGAPALPALWPRLREAMQGRVMVAHGAGTERRFLHAFPFHGFGPWVDTLAVARAVYPDVADYALEHLLTHLGLVAELDALCPGLRWHDALYDSVACLVFLRCLLREPLIREAPINWLIHPDASLYYKRRQF